METMKFIQRFEGWKSFFRPSKHFVLELLDECIIEESYYYDQFNCHFQKYKGRNFVYVLENGEQIIYIGHTKNLYTRIIDHKMNYNFTKFYIFEYDKYILLEKERAFIYLFQPEFNTRSKKS